MRGPARRSRGPCHVGATRARQAPAWHLPSCHAGAWRSRGKASPSATLEQPGRARLQPGIFLLPCHAGAWRSRGKASPSATLERGGPGETLHALPHQDPKSEVPRLAAGGPHPRAPGPLAFSLKNKDLRSASARPPPPGFRDPARIAGIRRRRCFFPYEAGDRMASPSLSWSKAGELQGCSSLSKSTECSSPGKLPP